MHLVKPERESLNINPPFHVFHSAEQFPEGQIYHRYTSARFPGISGDARNEKIALIHFLESAARRLRDELLES